MSSFPPSIPEFKALFVRDFTYGDGPEFVMDTDIQNGMNQALVVFNTCLWSSDNDRNLAFLFLAAHMMVTSIQGAGGLSSVDKGLGVQSQNLGTIESKTVGSVSLSYAIADFVRKSSILSPFMTTMYGQKFLMLVVPRLVGNVQVVAGEFPNGGGFAGNLEPLTITTQTLAETSTGYTYTQPIASNGGIMPLAWAVTDGTLPPGIVLGASTGVLSGVPTTAGSYNFTITLTDGYGHTAFMNYNLVVTA